jgi:transposase
MAWLGEELPRTQQADQTPFAPRCTKDLIEERLFAYRRDLFTELQLVFFDTTSIYFEGQGGETIGQRGHSKDHRPDLKQMIVGVVLDGQGRPICCELWPGNTADVTTLIPVVDRLRKRFAVGKVCIVADRGMISQETIAELEKPERGWQYILGARMRAQSEVKEEVLARAGRYRVVHPQRPESDAPAPLDVKEVWVEDRRYIVCRNQEEARKDAADREAIVASLREKLKAGEKALIGNKGYRRYLCATGPDHFQIDEAKIVEEARYDGKWVLRTNTELDAAEVAVQYKRLWMVEAYIRSCKSLLQTRPIYHKCDETIRGHVFCSFLAIVLRQELEARLARRGAEWEWADVIADLDRLQMAEVGQDGKRFLLRSEVQGTCGLVFQAAGVALPPTVQRVTLTPSSQESDPSATPPL